MVICECSVIYLKFYALRRPILRVYTWSRGRTSRKCPFVAKARKDTNTIFKQRWCGPKWQSFWAIESPRPDQRSKYRKDDGRQRQLNSLPQIRHRRRPSGQLRLLTRGKWFADRTVADRNHVYRGSKKGVDYVQSIPKKRLTRFPSVAFTYCVHLLF